MFQENFVSESWKQTADKQEGVSLSKTIAWEKCLYRVDGKLESVFVCKDCSLNIVKDRCISILLGVLLEESYEDKNKNA